MDVEALHPHDLCLCDKVIAVAMTSVRRVDQAQIASLAI